MRQSRSRNQQAKGHPNSFRAWMREDAYAPWALELEERREGEEKGGLGRIYGRHGLLKIRGKEP